MERKEFFDMTRHCRKGVRLCALSLLKNPMLAADARKQRFAARPAERGGLRTAAALRAVLVLGAAHP